jgi:heat shock protein HslJ
MTRMAGPPEAMEREAKYLAALEAAKSVARSASGELLITVADKELPLRFVATDPP